jgi:hypothetical protein
MSVKLINRDSLDSIASMLHLTAAFQTDVSRLKQALSSLTFNPEQVWAEMTGTKNQSLLKPDFLAKFLQ